mgnify:CR=1 FL=1|jgi:predicted amidohydrolase
MCKVKIACIQYKWRDTPADNLNYIVTEIQKIGEENKAEVIFLPEFIIGAPFHFPGRAHLKGVVDDTIPGKITSVFAELAKKYKLYIFGGTIVEREGENYYNSTFVIGPEGNILGKARKNHCYAAEMVAVTPGNEMLLLELPFGKVGVLVCSDFWIPEMPRILALKGAEIIYVAGSSLLQNISDIKPCMRANSVFNVCYTVFTSVIGSVEGTRVNDKKFKIEFGGHTTIAEPDRIMNSLDDEEAVLCEELDMDYIRELRSIDVKFQKTHFFSLWGRRPELYGDILNSYVEKNKELGELVEEYLNSKEDTNEISV